MLLTSYLGKVMEKIKVERLSYVIKRRQFLSLFHGVYRIRWKNGLISLFRIRNKESSGKRNTGNSGKWNTLAMVAIKHDKVELALTVVKWKWKKLNGTQGQKEDTSTKFREKAHWVKTKWKLYFLD